MRARGLVFEKYEGLGNDFLVVVAGDDAGDEASSRLPLTRAAVAAVCDRHRGVGGDGVLELRLPGGAGRTNARMVVHNADGSIPEMCGNGLRCVALALVRSHGFAAGDRFVVETDAGPRGCEVLGPSEVRVEIGLATVMGQREITVDGRTFVLHEASTGNPHAVTFWDEEQGDAVTDADIDRYGPLLATHPSFPNGANIGFARMRGGRETAAMDLVVWERGVGRTLACGTGASAAAAIAGARGLVDGSKPVTVHLPGGPLSILVTDGHVQMSGPAKFVFRGEWSEE